MNTQELTALLDRLRAEPHESEWLEFKANRFEPQALGEYLSALANSACLLGKPRAYLVFGIEDGSHAVVGTRFDPGAETVKGKEGKNNQLLPLCVCRWVYILIPALRFTRLAIRANRSCCLKSTPLLTNRSDFTVRPISAMVPAKPNWHATRKNNGKSGNAVWIGVLKSVNRPP
jgi:hypothetical protein